MPQRLAHKIYAKNRQIVEAAAESSHRKKGVCVIGIVVAAHWGLRVPKNLSPGEALDEILSVCPEAVYYYFAPDPGQLLSLENADKVLLKLRQEGAVKSDRLVA